MQKNASMNDQEKTREELIEELQELQQVHHSLKESYEKDINELKLVTKDRKSGLLSQILEATSGGVWDWNIQTGDAVFSPRYCSMLGYSPEEFADAYKSWKELVHPDDFDRVHQEHMDHFHHNKEFSIEFRMLEKSGNWHWIHARGILIERDGEGNPLRMVGTHTDIQERKLADLKLMESEIRFRTLSENEMVGVYILKQGKMTYVNPALARIFGYEPYELIGESPLKVIHPEDHALVTENIRRRIEGEVDWVAYEFRGLCKNGEIKNIEVRGSRISLINEIAVIGNILDITHQKQAEVMLLKAKVKAEESEIRFRSIVENTEAGYFFIDNDGLFQSVNRAWLNLYKYGSYDEVIGKHYTVVQQLEDIENAKVFVDGIRAGNPQFMIGDFTRKCKDGSLGYHTFSARPVFIDNKIAGIEGFIIDATKQRAFEQELLVAKEKAEKSEVKYHSMFSAMQEGVYLHKIIYDKKGIAVNYRIIEANAASEKYLNIKCDLAAGKLATELFQTDKAPFLDVYAKVAETGAPTSFEQYFQPMDKHFSISVFSPQKGEFATIFQDITDKKLHELDLLRAKEKAEENELMFRNLFENSPIGKSMTGIDGSLRVNNSFCEIVGYSDEELKKENLAYITHPEDLQSSNNIIQSLLNGEAEKASFEKRYIHKNGNIVWVDVSTYLQRDKENKPQFFITTIIDITERKNYEIEILKAKDKAEESDRLKSAFLANMSHEIRTPMNGILGFSDLLSEPGLGKEEQQAYINLIQKSGARMLNILSEIVEISKIESGTIDVKISEVVINNSMDSIYEFFKPEAEDKSLNLFYVKNSQVNEPIIQTDGQKLHAILTNLVKNAIKYTDQGSIEFGYHPVEIDGRHFLQFYVKDTGIGIPKDRQEAIFERFIQADIVDIQARQGAGLGLAIVKSYVEMLGGKVWVESEKRIGSTFYFTLPCNTEPKKEIISQNVLSSDKAENQINPQISGLKILIVDDDEIARIYLSIIIKKISNKILFASSGIEAVKICQSNPDINLILMDIQMPDMNGYEATQHIRKFNKEVIIAAQTAFAMAGDFEKSIEAGCNDYISKPIKKVELVALIQKYFKKLG